MANLPTLPNTGPAIAPIPAPSATLPLQSELVQKLYFHLGLSSLKHSAQTDKRSSLLPA
jgi:hypothetical protein